MAMDFDEFKELLESVETLQRQYLAFNEEFLVTMGMRALGKTKKLTPVDTGDLRGRWELSSVYREGNTLVIDLFNPLEYASHVEDGHMQRKRFLPLSLLQDSPKGKTLASELKTKYGPNTEGIMLKDKWIPGHHMARISITEVERQIPARYAAAFKKFLNELGVN